MVFKNFFSRYLFLTNSVTFSGLFGLGDFVEQQLERYKKKKKYKKLMPYDFPRTVRMIAVGALLSPVVHFWYLALDRVIVGKIHTVVFRKVLADETILSPVVGAAFLGGMKRNLPIKQPHYPVHVSQHCRIMNFWLMSACLSTCRSVTVSAPYCICISSILYLYLHTVSISICSNRCRSVGADT